MSHSLHGIVQKPKSHSTTYSLLALPFVYVARLTSKIFPTKKQVKIQACICNRTYQSAFISSAEAVSRTQLRYLEDRCLSASISHRALLFLSRRAVLSVRAA